ncbi:SGNH/GDSL hydrolase family protein [Afipia clevelandensis]|uniref:SGNH hydrolase-type esterase domain-containing protein n=1 Tax=Afipia clevelandensis ATCC 49720 TaxID=883079 RepID=K8P318_9BRAD|nr:SGNH family hydrolase [Afipia clevelandensis]EKS35124.1 hypothetical protein HMPREF9696_02396 [Afipia clevelandensis ATCC 49720]
MPKRTSFFRILTGKGPLAVFAVAGAMLFGIVAPASAQFFDFGFGRPQRPAPQRGGGFFSPFGDAFGPDRQQPAPRVDYSRAPAAAKRDTPADRNVLVLGDAMADWLAYGLEDALSETPDLGVIRKHKTVSGLIKYQPKGDPADWAAAAKGILATEKPDVIVVMLGLHDRIPIREPVVEKKPDAKPGDKADKKNAKKDSRGKPNEQDAMAKPGDKPAETGADSKTADSKASDADAAADDDDDQPQIMSPEKGRSAGGVHDFRDERWVELYAKKIEEMIAVLKSKGVPVLWVGLPAVRGPKATSDMLFLDALYRDGAGKAGITYVDVWDGFVDDAGRFTTQGPDFEGQIRRLRSGDGVFFTKAGARKLAHYTEREIRRVLAAHTDGPLAVPSETFAPDANIRPGEAGPRPLMGPVMPLVASQVGTDELLGGVGTRPASVDALAARTLVKGEPLAPPAGRADDFAWPRREVGVLSAPPSDPVVASAPADSATPPKPKPKKQQVVVQGLFNPNAPPQQRQRGGPRDGFARPSGNVSPSPFSGFFGFGRW